jgi:hypothetical protein
MGPIIIAHRANLVGRNPQTENTIKAARRALNKGFNVELDVWRYKDKWYLGHDKPEHLVNGYDFKSLLNDEFVWMHCKNKEALEYLVQNMPVCDFFWHDKDQYTLTAKNRIWTYPGVYLPESRGVAVMPENGALWTRSEILSSYAICTDFPYDYK